MNAKTLTTKSYKLHHTASRRGYISRKKPDGIIQPYQGTFGQGYIRLLPRWDTTQYCIVEYWTEV